MKKIWLASGFLSIFILALSVFSYAETMDIGQLVDSFYKATDLQREKILKDNLGKEVACGGKVNNVGEYDFFDTVNGLKGSYFQAVIEPKKTKNDAVYQLIFLFKDREKAANIDKGQDIQKDGKIIKIIDERLQISVWIFCGEQAEEDKLLLKKD